MPREKEESTEIFSLPRERERERELGNPKKKHNHLRLYHLVLCLYVFFLIFFWSNNKLVPERIGRMNYEIPQSLLLSLLSCLFLSLVSSSLFPLFLSPLSTQQPGREQKPYSTSEAYPHHHHLYQHTHDPMIIFLILHIQIKKK